MHDREYPADPYPGAVPEGSFVHLDRVGHRLYPDSGRDAGWRMGKRDLDDWLAERGAPPLAGRVPVLAYGSNRCPSKITWLRESLGLTGPVVVLAATVRDAAAVWAAGLRARDGQRPAVLAAAPGVTERHSVWMATPEQVVALDRCEGRGERYRLARLRAAAVRTEDGAVLRRPWCYLGLGRMRRPLLVDGAPVRCESLAQDRAMALRGVAADSDGLVADEVVGAPHPDQWPCTLFSYGSLQPGRSAWSLVEPHLAGEPLPARAAGRVYDTGLGYPAMLPDVSSATVGTLLPLRNPARVLSTLDDYEGPQYRRVRLVLPDTGAVSWAYVWTGGRDRLLAEQRAGISDTANRQRPN